MPDALTRSMQPTRWPLCLAIAFLVVPQAAIAGTQVNLRLREREVVRIRSERIRPLRTPAVPVVAPPPVRSPALRRLTARRADRRATCLDTGVRCRGAGINWTGNLILADLSPDRQLVATGWGMSLHDGTSTSEQIFTAGIRQRLSSYTWIQLGGGFAKSRVTFAERGRWDSAAELVPAVSMGLGIDVMSTRELDIDFGVTAATAVSQLSNVEHFRSPSIYNLNVGFTGAFR
jgi:hypothetical protein